MKEQFNNVDWKAVNTTNFRDKEVKYKKQAEFLVY
ncbi:MAG: DUF4433 domain-containing protein [Proteobacteria bacterium]|nr:DUF4433 domain-containing protein [Pseudomonadota bacterium]